MRHPRRQGAHGHEARNNETSRPSSGSRTATRNHPPSPRGRDEELKICGGHGPGETPGPIPNPEAKAWHGDGTAPERMWESSTPPHSPSQGPPVEHHAPGGSFLHPHPQKPTHAQDACGPARNPRSPAHTPTPDARPGRTTPKASRIPQPTRKHTLKTTDKTSTGFHQSAHETILQAPRRTYGPWGLFSYVLPVCHLDHNDLA